MQAIPKTPIRVSADFSGEDGMIFGSCKICIKKFMKCWLDGIFNNFYRSTLGLQHNQI